jgi:hypothetical protein
LFRIAYIQPVQIKCTYFDTHGTVDVGIRGGVDTSGRLARRTRFPVVYVCVRIGGNGITDRGRGARI